MVKARSIVNRQSLKNGLSSANAPLLKDWTHNLLTKRLEMIRQEIALLQKDATHIEKLIANLSNTNKDNHHG